jgi:hypothetical protein
MAPLGSLQGTIVIRGTPVENHCSKGSYNDAIVAAISRYENF